MKVRDLISELKNMPQGAEVVWRAGENPGTVVQIVKNESHVPPGDDNPLPEGNGLVVVLS
ncbi:hypothetical protein ACSZNZ_22130 [Aeromonas caviae]|uniref:hypothetical protein n=1 Tax=Aeromonas TaxID=642 RepID=UPI003EC6DD88